MEVLMMLICSQISSSPFNGTPATAECSHPVIGLRVFQFSEVQEHLFQGSFLLPKFEGLCAELGKKSSNEVVE
jgi:hypothetical protein